MAHATPRLRIEAACDRLGRDAVIERCLSLLAGGEEAPDFVVMLGGAPATRLLAEGVRPAQAYWLRVWAARGLLWAGLGDDPERVRVGFRDEAWRVREMACKVVARHGIDDLLDDVIGLEADPVPRVRAAATRAAVRVVADGTAR